MNYSFTTLAESYLHRLDSVAVPLSPDWGIRWYGLAYAAGFIVAWLLIRWMARTGRSLIPERAVGDLMMYSVVGVLVGGRLGYALFYRPELFLTFSAPHCNQNHHKNGSVSHRLKQLGWPPCCELANNRFGDDRISGPE